MNTDLADTMQHVSHEDGRLMNAASRMQCLIESARIGTWEWNVQTGETTFNDIWAQIIGYSLEELHPVDINTWEKHAHPEDLKESSDLLGCHFRGETPYFDFECRMIHKDGHTVWIHDRGRLMSRTTDGKPLLMFGTHIDITERKQAEINLRENERMLRESQNVARLGSYIWNISTGIWQSSKIMDEIFGIDAGYNRSLEGWVALIHPDWQEVMNDYIANDVIAKRKTFDKEYKTIRQCDGQERWVHGLGLLEFDSNDKPVRLIGTISDITERKLAELALKKKSTELEQFNKLMVGREVRMIELKREINELLGRLGEKAKYQIHT